MTFAQISLILNLIGKVVDLVSEVVDKTDLSSEEREQLIKRIEKAKLPTWDEL